MENNSSLFKQAIAEAKALRQSAYELAKEQIAETFGPRVQEMIRLKLSEMEEEPVVEAKDEEEKKVMETVDQEDSVMETEDMVDETTLDELLAELEETDEVSEAKKDDEKDEIKEAEGDEEEESEESEEETEEDGEEEAVVGDEPAEEVTELSVEELKDIIRDVVADVMGSREGAEDNLEGDDTIDLSSPGAEEAEPGGEEEALGEITLDEILASLEEADKEPMEEKKEEKVEETKKVKQDLQEALKVVKTLQTELNEVRLLNAKLLYLNKIFNSNNLDESQKLKVMNAFDRAETVKEAKKIYETLKDSVVAKKPLAKKPLKESMGFASKPAGVAPRVKPIVEQNDIVNRWQILAGIKKAN